MSDREKLYELIRKAYSDSEQYCLYTACCECPADEENDGCMDELVVDHLISNGVTVQKHGRWVDVYDGKYDNPRYACSECQEKALYTFEVDALGHEIAVQELSDHCPECGAKMDGD